MTGRPWWFLILAASLAACAQFPQARADQTGEAGSSPARETREPLASAAASSSVPDAPLRAAPSAPAFLQGELVSVGGFPPPTPLDLDHWPFGWVRDAQAERLGLVPRFWSDQKSLWTEALGGTAVPRSVRLLTQIHTRAANADEAFRASWRLWGLYRQAGLSDEARTWLDQAVQENPLPVALLDRAWDDVFRRRILGSLPPTIPPGPWPTAADASKASLLRQKLFLGTRDLAALGADNFVSCLALDRDDLWAGTWNGAVVRWSLTTGQTDLLLGPGPSPSPVKALAATSWFLYAFQDTQLRRYSKVTGVWRSFPYPESWTGLRVQGVVADGEESLWVAYLGQGLWHWTAGEWKAVDGGGCGPFLNALASDGTGGFLVGTKDRGLWTYRKEQWSPVGGSSDRVPTNISALALGPEGSVAVGTWGEGVWLLETGQLHPLSLAGEYVTGVAWGDEGPLWGTLEGLGALQNGVLVRLGPTEGISGGVSSVESWGGRWLWGTMGNGLAWWSEHENSALFR